jgi:hypothetical protein
LVVGDANTDTAQEEILSHSKALEIVIDRYCGRLLREVWNESRDRNIAVNLLNYIRQLACIILKSQPADNKLGTRILAGKFATVNSDLGQLQGSSLVPPEQNSDPWSARIHPPYEELS